MSYSQGELRITQLDITNFNGSKTLSLLEYFSTCQFSESIFENCMTGSIDIADSVSIRNDLPVIGQETLIVQFDTGQTEFRKEYRVYKVSNEIKLVDSESRGFTIYFASKELIDNEQIVIKKIFKNKTVSTIARDLLNELSPEVPLDFQETVGIQNLVISSKKPLQAINLMSSYAIPTDSLGSIFSFYENPTGYHFKNIESLYAGEVVQSFSTDVSSNDGSSQDEFIEIKEYKIIKRSDVLGNINKGMFYNKVYSLDLLTRTYKFKDYDYQRDFSNTLHIDSGVPFFAPGTEPPSSFVEKLIPTKSSRQNSSFIKANTSDSTFKKGIEDVLPYRISMMQQLMSQVMQVTVDGNTNVKAGDIIEINMKPTATKEDNMNELEDQEYSGRWLIVSLTHNINEDEIFTIMNCSKDVFHKIPESRL